MDNVLFIMSQEGLSEQSAMLYMAARTVDEWVPSVSLVITGQPCALHV